MNLKLFSNYDLIPVIKSLEKFIPIFATKNYANYLEESSNSKTFWIVHDSESMKLMIPFSIMKKGPFTKGTFLTSVISSAKIGIQEEKQFLNEVIKLIRRDRLCDWIQQGPNWAIFKTYPEGSIYAPFGTYRINLEDKTEEALMANLDRKVRGRIRKLYGDNEVEIKSVFDSVDDSIELINNTLEASNVDTFNDSKFAKIIEHLEDNVMGFTTYHNNVPQSSLIYFFNSYSVYGIYAGSKYKAVQGATEIINWETIKECKKMGIRYFDCVGARINPDPNSKLYRIQRNKSHLGTELKEGFIFKMVFNNYKYYIYRNYVELLYLIKGKKNKGDIIDQERKRLNIR